MKRRALTIYDESYNTVDKRVVITRDDYYQYDRDECDRPIKFYGTNTRYCTSDRGAEFPFETTTHYFDKQGSEVYEYADDIADTKDVTEPKDGFIVFPVSAYIHSGIVWSLGDGSSFPDAMWDVATMGYMYTNKALYEAIYGKDTWMTIYDKDTKHRRPAYTSDEFKEHIRKLASADVDELNLAEEGSVYAYTYEEAHPLHITTHDRKTDTTYTSDTVDYETEDSCCGFLTDKLDDIDFIRDTNVPVYLGEDVYLDDCYTIPTYVITHNGKFLSKHVKGKRSWVTSIKDADVFYSYNTVHVVACEHIDACDYDCNTNIIKLTEAQERELGIN